MNNFQIQQSLLYNLICNTKRPHGAYTFYRQGEKLRTMYNAKEHFESIYPRIRKNLVDVHFYAFKHGSMFDLRKDYKTFIEEYRKDCINAVHAELQCVTRNIDSEPCIMSYVKQRKSLPRVQIIISRMNDLLYKLYRELLIRLFHGQNHWCDLTIIEKEELVFLSCMETQENLILDERENTDTVNKLTPFEKPHDIEWRPKKHCSFTENTQTTMKTLLLGIRHMQKNNQIPSLDPMVLEEAFSTFRISDEIDLSVSDDSDE